MKTFALRNETNGRVLATQVARAGNVLSRGIGLLGRAKVSPDEGLWIDGCSAVHTIGMRATIDLYFLDKKNVILRIVNAARPNRLAIACRNAVAVVELGAAPELGRDVLVGDQLVLE
ncbi:MAG: DUF192 domain-containing protein [Candidatus Baltobacteraceae bacterium]|jgi:hypothetical protein